MSRVSILLAVVLIAGHGLSQTISGPFVSQHSVHGSAADTWMGFSVDGAGDVNQDGFDDVIVGAIFADPGGRADAGSAFVYSGKDGSLIWQFDGGSAGDGLGISVRKAGDVNRDGYPDVVVGASEADPDGKDKAGSAFVYSGKDGSTIWQFDGSVAGDELGHYVDGAGDVNVDGYPDVIVGAPRADPSGVDSAGSAFVYSGVDGTVLWSFHGSTVNERLGWAVAGAGDTNGDTFFDVIVGSRYADPGMTTDGGSAFVYSGKDGTKLWQFDGVADDDQLGRSVDGAGDVNDDGFADLIVGAPRAEGGGLNDAGSAFVYSGFNGSLLWQFDGTAAEDDLGTAVSAAGDVNGDDFDDVIVGARLADPAGNISGSAYLYSGVDGTLLGQFDGSGADQQLGFAVGSAGDTNGDGCADVVVGAILTNIGANNTGSAFVFTYDLRTTWTGSVNGTWNNAGNWDNGIPSAAFAAVIPVTATSPVIDGVNTDCKSLTVETGAALTFQNSGILNVHGGATIGGTVSGTGLVRFATDGSGTIVGAPGGTLGDVVIDGGDYTMDAITITGDLEQTFDAGDLWIGTVVVEGSAIFEGERALALGAGGDLLVEMNVRYSTNDQVLTPPSFIRCRGDWEATGSFTPSAGTIIFDGNGAIQQQAVNADELHSVIIEGQADVSLNSLNEDKVIIRGDLDVQGKMDTAETALEVEGDLTVGNGAEVRSTTTTTTTVGGDLSVSGTLDLSGDLELNGSDPSSMEVAGILDFEQVRISNSERTAESSFTIEADVLHIADGGGLAVEGQTVNLDPIAVTVEGLMTAGPGGTFAADSGSSITVTTGTLKLLGSLAAPARLIGFLGGGYSLEITDTGTLEASNFEIRGADQDGLQIRSGATIGAAPNDLRGGLFADGDPTPGSALLTLERTSPVELRYLTFENAGTATFNIRSGTTAPINVVNYEGSFGGPVFEDDPSDIITWTQNDHTDVESFEATGALDRVALALTTTREVDAASFHLLRSDNPGGPFEEVMSFSAMGNSSSGATYELTDLDVTYPTQYFYRLEEELLHEARRALDSDFARPLPMQVGNSYFVGIGGFADIAAAVAAAPAGANIVVAAGTYAPFSTDKAVRIFADGSGPVHIDTTTAPVVINNIAANQMDTALYGLDIGDGMAPFGLEIRNCDNVVVLDSVSMSAAGVPALLLDDSPRVAVQSCVISGGPGLEVTTGSTVFLSKGTLNSLVANGGSSVTYLDVPPFTTSVTSATVQALAGTMPRVEFPNAWPDGKNLDFTLTGTSADLWALLLVPKKGFTDASLVIPGDMVILSDLGLPAPLLAAGVFPPAGTVEFTAATVPLQLGVNIPVQFVTLSPAMRFRLGNVRDVVIFP